MPAAVGVDIGCGMMAARTSLVASDLPDNLAGIRSAISARTLTAVIIHLSPTSRLFVAKPGGDLVARAVDEPAFVVMVPLGSAVAAMIGRIV